MASSVIYFDLFGGASGNMIVGAILDAGLSLERLEESLAGLGLGGYRLRAERVRRGALAATHFSVELTEEHSPHRGLSDVLAIIEAARLPEAVRRRASDVFRALAEAEAHVHGIEVQRVHFHEVGAVDAIVDVVAACVGLAELEVGSILSSPVPVGSGTVRTAHGMLPVPAPATTELLKGVPLAAHSAPYEMTTPTGAAILTVLADAFGPPPALTLRRIGYGAGEDRGKDWPNVLRVLVGEPAEAEGREVVTVLEANIDDASPQVIAHAFDRLLQAGALDVFLTPVQMKKGRAGVLLTVLCTPPLTEKMEEIVFAETPTFGIRKHSCARSTLRREHVSVETPYGPIRIKRGRRGEVITDTPEYEDCRSAARRHGVPLRQVQQAALASLSAGAQGGS